MIRARWSQRPAVTVLVAALLALSAGPASADPIVGGGVTVQPSQPAATATGSASVPGLSLPGVVVTTTQPITAGATATVGASSTPMQGSASLGGPGTSAEVPISVIVGGTDGAPASPGISVTVPTIPSASADASAPLTPTTDATVGGGQATGGAGAFTRSTGAGAEVSEPANRIAVSAEATATVCLLANAIGRTSLDPALRSSLSTLCDGTPSQAGAGLSATMGDTATVGADAAAAVCLVANVLALPAPLSSETLARLGLDTRCGTAPSTALGGVQVSGPGGLAADASIQAALCVLLAATAGVPTTADASTACGALPSVATGGLGASADGLGAGRINAAAALCVVASAVAALPTTVDLTTACGDQPSTIGGHTGADVAGVAIDTRSHASLCVELGAVVPGTAALGAACPAPRTVLGSESPADQTQPAQGLQPAPGRTGTTGPRDTAGVQELAQAPAISQLPATATAAAGVGGLALIALALTALRRRAGHR